MKKILPLFLTFILFTSCGTIHRVSSKKETKVTKYNKVTATTGKAKKVLKEAHRFMGTPYKYGGTTRRGMDCSGLLLNAYKAANIDLPRVSRDQAESGRKIRLAKVKPGDALFFKTSGSKINHTGIVDHIVGDEVFFIHASSSRGVMVSSLENSYWKKRFVKAVRYFK